MSTMPAVVVKKGGFLSAFFNGLFGLLIVIVLCAGGLGFYALRIVDSKLDEAFALPGDVISSLPEWRQRLPRLVAEMLDDRRAPDYREQVAITAETRPSPENSSRKVTVVDVANNGSETITVLALNVTLENAKGVPISERRVYAATPIAVDEGEWRGPLLPAESRRFVVEHHGRCRDYQPGGLDSTIGVAEIRLWNGPREEQLAVPAGEQAVLVD